MVPKTNEEAVAPKISLGIIAWNEEDSIGDCLKSLFQQSLFQKLRDRRMTCEIICVANGCTDSTPVVVQKIFDAQTRHHPHRATFTCRVLNLRERGKLNAWNVFVHKASDPDARFLFLMDGDILVHHRNTLWNMAQALMSDAEAAIAVDLPRKDISLKPRPTLLEKISLATSAMTRAGTAQLTGQLYCIRANIARNIYLPRDLGACEDGFIKNLVCTDFLTRRPQPARIKAARNASHIFEAYSSIKDILKNQKRQMIGQTIVHLLVDKHLKRLPTADKKNLGEFLRDKDQQDPDWLKRLIHKHVRSIRFGWQLYPGIPGHQFRKLGRMRGLRRIGYFPVALVGLAVSLVASGLAFRALKQGSTNYWPDTKSRRLKEHVVSAPSPKALMQT